ncbi:MAG: VTT domain-containing protein [Acidobacteriota bacterium]|nr:VTT domain-containing protein [Blastocatellia bacterium]MDW8241369.1 VTT domain-containing protein [Acidobacteriota bacterium]
MNELLELLRRYGYQLIFANLFLEAIGLPLPAAIILLAAGAMCAVGWFNIYGVMLTAIVGMLLGDVLMYYLGRTTGWAILSLLCRISLNPESCIIKSARTFYHRGRTTLLFCKFLPGLNTVAPPLAGSLNMRLGQFVSFDLIGVTFYISFYTLLGFLFSQQLERIGRGFMEAKMIVAGTLITGLAGYVIYRLRRYTKERLYRDVPRVSVHHLKRRMEQAGDQIAVYDARSHGYYEAQAVRIPGSKRLEPAFVMQMMPTLPRNKEMYLYCT